MAVLLSPETILKTGTIQFAQLLLAYHECSDEIRSVIDEMSGIIVDPDTDEDDRTMAASTIMEALFPAAVHDGLKAFGSKVQSRESKRVRLDLENEETVFADRLRAEMERKNISQETLAALTGVGQPAISNILTRRCRPQRKTVARFAQALNVSEEELWPAQSRKDG
jgi:lambda repressor-like predicted transcriptional regulator